MIIFCMYLILYMFLFTDKLKSEQSMSRTECGTTLRYVSSAISNTAEYAAQSAYLVTFVSFPSFFLFLLLLRALYITLLVFLSFTCFLLLSSFAGTKVSTKSTRKNNLFEY